MVDHVLQIIAPHHCYGCAKSGTLLCVNCKYDIASEQISACISCGLPSPNGICIKCHEPYQKAWCVGERRSVLEQLIDAYKFEHVKAAHRTFAELLDEALPLLPPETIVVPLPTVAPHIRQRGYDHMLLVARSFAKRRGLQLSTALRRVGANKQLGSSRKDRIAHAKSAYEVSGELDPTVPYLLLDDVFTTGASLHYAALKLREAGAREIWVAVIARQPLDNKGLHLLKYDGTKSQGSWPAS